jgi:hypothetical protein
MPKVNGYPIARFGIGAALKNEANGRPKQLLREMVDTLANSWFAAQTRRRLSRMTKGARKELRIGSTVIA